MKQTLDRNEIIDIHDQIVRISNLMDMKFQGRVSQMKEEMPFKEVIENENDHTSSEVLEFTAIKVTSGLPLVNAPNELSNQSESFSGNIGSL